MLRSPSETRMFAWCVVRPREAIFLPRGWWHGTCNLDDNNVAIGYIGGWTNQIHQAAANADWKGVKSELGKGADPYDSDAADQGATPVHAAALSGHAKIVKALIAKVKHRKDFKLLASETLRGTCGQGHISVAKALIHARADVNHQHEKSCVISAVEFGSVDFVKFLIEVRANLHGTAAVGSNTNSASELVHEAALKGHRELVEFLLRPEYKPHQNWSIDSISPNGKTLLHDSMVFPHVTETVLSHGANVSVRDREHRTVLHLAAESANSHNHRLVEWMVQHKVDINARDAHESQALHLAASYGNPTYVEALLLNRADIQARNLLSKSPLRLAAEAGHRQVARILLQNGALAEDVDLKFQTDISFEIDADMMMLTNQASAEWSGPYWHEGRPYWHNARTGESSWEQPAAASEQEQLRAEEL